MNDKIISVLIGLVGACSSNPKTENTDMLVLKALAYAGDSEAEIQSIIDDLRTEKNRIAPGCATCAYPCGNTSDYDMDRINASDGEISRLKRKILSKLHIAAAASTVKYPSEAEMNLLYKALTYVGCDIDAAALVQVLDELNMN